MASLLALTVCASLVPDLKLVIAIALIDSKQTDNYWLTTRQPTLTYGVRGIATFSIDITGAKDDLHSGIYGRMVHEPLTDLVKLLGKLVDTNGVITVPGVEDLVPPPTEEEM